MKNLVKLDVMHVMLEPTMMDHRWTVHRVLKAPIRYQGLTPVLNVQRVSIPLRRGPHHAALVLKVKLPTQTTQPAQNVALVLTMMDPVVFAPLALLVPIQPVLGRCLALHVVLDTRQTPKVQGAPNVQRAHTIPRMKDRAVSVLMVTTQPLVPLSAPIAAQATYLCVLIRIAGTVDRVRASMTTCVWPVLLVLAHPEAQPIAMSAILGITLKLVALVSIAQPHRTTIILVPLPVTSALRVNALQTMTTQIVVSAQWMD